MAKNDPHPSAARDAGGGLLSLAAVPLTSGPGARTRITHTAARLFYHEGIRAVGIDRLIAESAVTKATFYKHFGSKDLLILTYLRLVHEESVGRVNDIEAEHGSGVATLRALVDQVRDEVSSDGFRGCAFINAAAEFPAVDHPLREIITTHRDWYSAFLAEQFRQAGHPLPGDAADEFVVLRDGAMIGGYVGDQVATSAALSRLSNHCLASV